MYHLHYNLYYYMICLNHKIHSFIMFWDYFTYISSVFSKQIYEGYWFDTTTAVALQALSKISEMISGTIILKLYKGKVYFEKVEKLDEVSHSLYTDDSSMENIGDFNHVDSQGFMNILGLSAKNLGLKQKNHEILDL